MQRLSYKWVQIVLIWALMVIAFCAVAIFDGKPFKVTGDDAMRLVGAIDLFQGQSWFDVTQYRDNAPFGASMHWSRLIDAPLVMLMAIFTPFAHEAAPYWAAFVWPLLVLLAVMALVAELTEQVAGRQARLAALVLLALSLAVYTEFVPGRVDHHNVQIMLVLAMIITAIKGRTSVGWAIAAGAAAATGLAIGTEVLPAVVAALVCFALYWIIEPGRVRLQTLAFAASFPLALMLHLMGTSPIGAWLTPACDALSVTYVVAGLCYGAAMMLVVLGARLLGTIPLRLLALAMLGALTLAVLFWLFPECRNGPYGNLDADLAAILFPEIGEAQPIWVWASGMRAEMALVLTPLVGMAAVLLGLLRAPADQRWRWVVLAGFCLALFVVFCLQVRGFRLLSIAVLPGVAWIATRLWSWFTARQTLASAAIIGLTLPALTGAVQWSVITSLYPIFVPSVPDQDMINWDACVDPQAYAALAALPPGQMMSYLLIGPQLLLETPHGVVSAGYHRNEAGLRDMVRFYSGGEAEARAVARERGLDYLVFCRGVPPTNGLAGLPDFAGLSWAWLTPISPLDATLQIYAIKPD